MPKTDTFKVHIYWDNIAYFHEINKHHSSVIVADVINSAISAMKTYSTTFEKTSKGQKSEETAQDKVDTLNAAISVTGSSKPHPGQHFKVLSNAQEGRHSRDWKLKGEKLFKSISIVETSDNLKELAKATQIAEVIFDFCNEDYDMCENSDEDIECI